MHGSLLLQKILTTRLLPPSACKYEPGRLVPRQGSKNCSKNWLHSSCMSKLIPIQVLVLTLCFMQLAQFVLASQSFYNLVHALSLLIPTALPLALFLAALPIFLARTALPHPCCHPHFSGATGALGGSFSLMHKSLKIIIFYYSAPNLQPQKFYLNACPQFAAPLEIIIFAA